jgi:hypothetical protein
MNIAASVAKSFKVVLSTLLTSLSVHSGHSLFPSSLPQNEQVVGLIEHAIVPRNESSMLVSTISTENKMQNTKVAATDGNRERGSESNG